MILVHLSGGLDSTGMLVKLLTETNEELLVHHGILKSTKQWESQYAASKKIVEYCRKHYRNFEFKTTEMDFKLKNYSVSSLLYWSTAGLAIIESDPRIFAVARGVSSNFDLMRPQIRKIFKLLYEGNLPNNRKIIQLYPVEGLDKWEIAKYIPKELQKLVRSCDHSSTDIPCNQCPKCLAKKAAEDHI